MSDRKEFEDWFFSPSNSMSMSDMNVAWDAWQVSAILALQKNNFSHERVPMTDEQRHEIICRYDEGKTYSDLVGIILATEAKHGITAQRANTTKKGDE